MQSKKKKFYHIIVNQDSGRQYQYSCANKSSAKPISSFIFFFFFFETGRSRGSLAEQISHGKYIVFGKILYFIEHFGVDGRLTVVSCVKTFSETKFDPESGLLHSSEEALKHNVYIRDSMSYPLVTAKEDNDIQFLNCNRSETE